MKDRQLLQNTARRPLNKNETKSIPNSEVTTIVLLSTSVHQNFDTSLEKLFNSVTLNSEGIQLDQYYATFFIAKWLTTFPISPWQHPLPRGCSYNSISEVKLSWCFCLIIENNFGYAAFIRAASLSCLLAGVQVQNSVFRNFSVKWNYLGSGTKPNLDWYCKRVVLAPLVRRDERIWQIRVST